MKRVLPAFAVLLISTMSLAQAPGAFKYQAVLRDASGQIRAGENAQITLTILQGSLSGMPVYTETHDVTTNNFGLVNLEAGRGTSSDDLSAVDWSNGPYFLKIDVDGIELGSSELLSVPYSLYAEEAGNSFSGDYNDLTNKPVFTETDPAFNASPAASITAAGSGEVITNAERDRLNNAITLTGAVEEGNLISYDGNNWVAKDLVINSTGGGQPIDNMQPFLGIHYCIALQGIFPSRSGLEPFIAEIMLFAGTFAPRGWAFCDGQLLSISQNTALFALIGTTYGGDGRTTFGLPDLRGRVPLHPGTGPGLTNRSLGQRGGQERIILNVNQLPAHDHTVRFE